MNLKLQRAIDRYVGVPLCALFSVLAWRPGRARQAAKGKPVERILVILLSEMGSLVLAYPMFSWLRQQHPNAELYALVFEKNREVLDLMKVMPAAHVLTIRDKSASTLCIDSLRVIRRMRQLNIDVSIDCELFARISAIFSFLSGARKLSGFFRYAQEGLYRGTFITHRVLYNPYRHIADQFLGLAQSWDDNAQPSNKNAAAPLAKTFQLPKLEVTAAEIGQSKSKLNQNFAATTGRELVLIYPGGGILPIRAWPAESYAEICRKLIASGRTVAVIGLASDKALAQDIVKMSGSEFCLDLTGYTRNVRELLVLFHHAQLLITNDGGPGQFAAMTPIDSIVLFGPETPVLYGSLTPRSISIHLEQHPCSPCLTAYNHRQSPCDGDNQCLKRITPAQIMAVAMQKLTEPADARA